MDDLHGCTLLLDRNGKPKGNRYPVMVLYKGSKVFSGVYLKNMDWDIGLSRPKTSIPGYVLKIKQIKLACERLAHKLSLDDLSNSTTHVKPLWQDVPIEVDNVYDRVVQITGADSEEPAPCRVVPNNQEFNYSQGPMYIQGASFVTDCTHTVEKEGLLYQPTATPISWPTRVLEPWDIPQKQRKVKVSAHTKVKKQREATPLKKKTAGCSSTAKSDPCQIKLNQFWSNKEGMVGGLKKSKQLFRRYEFPHIYPTVFKGRRDNDGNCYVIVVCSYKNRRSFRWTGVSLPFKQWDRLFARPLLNTPNYGSLMKLIGRTMRATFIEAKDWI